MYVYVYICVCMGVYIYLYVYVYMCVYIYIYVCVYICVCVYINVFDAIWENPSDVALGRFQEIRKIGRMSFFFVKIRFSLNYYSITSDLSSLKISGQNSLV